MDEYEKGAADIIARIEAIYVPTHHFVAADAAEFRHLDLKFYGSFLEELEGHGYTHLADVEDLTLSHVPGSIMKRILIRTMLSPDRTIMASAYDPKLRFRWWLLLFLLGKAPAPVLDFETEFSDGAFVATSNAAAASAMEMPPLIVVEYLPARTPADVLLARHTELLRAYADVTGATPRTVSTHEELVQAQNRMNAIKAAYRNQLGGITAEELERTAGPFKDTAKRIHEKVVELRGRNAANPDQVAGGLR